ncbi:restriction endonuclease [Methanoculleus sp.]|uniref:restriction endonuclease n=1 Tax=Methanoculleus sp. TaxID=90427 RepID=UPI002FCB2D9B
MVMSVPDYESIMLPLLKLTADGKEHLMADDRDILADKIFHLTDDERRVLQPSGRSRTYDNRFGWARTYLTKAGLVEVTGRGRYKITQRGVSIVRNKPPTINTEFLMQFPEFEVFKRASSQNGGNKNAQDKINKSPSLTPEEVLHAANIELRQKLAQEILERLKACDPSIFEDIVVDLLVRMGYGGSHEDAGEAIGRSGDGGVDGRIKEDRLGLDVIYIQAKRWEGSVGRPVVQAFAGSLEGQRAKKGVFITTSQFSQEAKEYVKIIEKKIVLIDGEQLAQYMIDYNVGVTETASYVIKKVDPEYFGDLE